MTPDRQLLAAGSILTRILAESPVPAEGPAVLTVWEAFKRFAVLPIEPKAPERLDEVGGDLLLFEWGVYEWPWSEESTDVFLADLVRQFSVMSEAGEYDRMEQVHCSMSFKPLPGLRQLGNGTLWSNGDRDRWFTQVEQSGTFAAVRTRTALVVHVEHEQL